MTFDSHALSSIASSLDDITRRIADITSEMVTDDDEALIELAEVERQLTTAGRRLDKIVHRQR